MPQFFPYAPRKHQADMMARVKEALDGGKHLVLESSTGSGKTAGVLAPALEHALREGRRILYLTRTNAQARQVIVELRDVRDFLRRSGDAETAGKVLGVALQGRRSMCPLAQEDPAFAGGTPDEAGKLCSDRKKSTLEALKSQKGESSAAVGRAQKAIDITSPSVGSGTTCPYFAGNCGCDFGETQEWFKANMPFAEEFLGYCRGKTLCPHELNKEMAQHASVVVAPYIYFLDNFMRVMLLDWMRCSLPELVVVVDEAHNLPDYARDLRSMELGRFTLEAAIREAAEFGDPEALKGIGAADFCQAVLRALLEIVGRYVRDEDSLIPPDELEMELMSEFSITSRRLSLAAENLVVIGETIRERQRMDRRLPRSYVHSVGSFLFFWLNLESNQYAKLAVGGDNPRLEGYCLDPSLATEVLNACHATVHMSGTLRPLEEYRDSIGLPKASAMEAFPSPFPKKNLRVCYSSDVTTKYELLEKNLPALKAQVDRILKTSKRNTAFFFPSYDMMSRFSPLARGHQGAFIESRDMRQEELLSGVDRFRKSGAKGEGAALFAVTGGRLSEGLDFPDKELEAVAVVGIPFPKPCARQTVLQHYYDVKFSKGWEYTVKAPTVRKLLQGIGRMIRTETDRGIAVILDSRATQFREYIDGMKATKDPAGEIESFWR